MLCSLTLTALCAALSYCTTDYKDTEAMIHEYEYNNLNMKESPEYIPAMRYRQHLKDNPTVMRNATELKASMEFTPKKVIQALKALAVEFYMTSAAIVTERRFGNFTVP